MVRLRHVLAEVGRRAVTGLIGLVGIVCFGAIGLGLLGVLPNADSTSAVAHHTFCDRHRCIASFDDGVGYIVRCADGMWSHSGGRQGACSDHGGEQDDGFGDGNGFGG